MTTLYDDGGTPLQGDRNQVAAINSLPDEVLLAIFWYAKSDKIRWEMLEYLPITWICRHWRVLALHSPEFWSLIDLVYSKRNGVLQEMLQRSQSATLSIGRLGQRLAPSHLWRRGVMGWVDSDFVSASFNVKSEYRFFKKSIVPVMRRVKTLELKFSLSHLLPLFRLLREAEFSIARCRLLEITERGFVYPILRRWGTGDAVLFLSRICNSQALRVLDIQFYHLPESLPVLSTFSPMHNLRELALSSSRSPTGKLQDLLRILEGCRLELRTLKLCLLAPQSPPSVPLSYPRISMPRLCTLILDSPADTSVLACLSTPALKRLYIDAKYRLPLVGPISCCMDFATLPHMKVEGRCILGYRDAHFDGPEPEVALRIKDHVAGDGPIAANLSEWVGHLASLTMEESMGDRRVPQRILERAPLLRSVDIHCGLEEVLPFLAANVTAYPKLELLTYRCTTYRAPPAKKLVALVRSRRNGGVALKKLIIYCFQALARRALEELEDLVDYCCIDECAMET